MNYKKQLNYSINKLGDEFKKLDLTFHKMKNGKPDDVTSYWPGKGNEEIMVCVFKGQKIHEPFHRQDFFFLNYAYKNSYKALSAQYNNLITISENQCYIGQPYSGYALRGQSKDEEIIIVGILIKRETFYKNYLPIIYSDSDLFRFFINPNKNKFSEEFIHLSFDNDSFIKPLLELMVIEYANSKEDTQLILKSLFQTLILEILRFYKKTNSKIKENNILDKILEYAFSHSDGITLKKISEHFSYHPNYISALIHKNTGKKFTEIVLEKRMEKALLLMKNTNLPIEEIASMLGYSNHSNFYKVFKEYFGVTPRKYR